MENSSSYCPCMKPAASSAPSLWGTSKYLASFPCTVPEFIIWSPELLQSVIPSNWCDLALGHGVKLICRPAGRGRCPLHLRQVLCGFVCCLLQGADMALGGTKEGGSLLHVMAPGGWQGGTATAGCLGTAPASLPNTREAGAQPLVQHNLFSLCLKGCLVPRCFAFLCFQLHRWSHFPIALLCVSWGHAPVALLFGGVHKFLASIWNSPSSEDEHWRNQKSAFDLCWYYQPSALNI